MPPFDPNNYTPAVAALLTPDRTPDLGPGSPNPDARAALDRLTLDTAFADHPIADPDMAKACLAALLLHHDQLDQSHVISQSIKTPTGSYWHGIMHRREPDYSNAKYWFRKVADHPVFPDVCAAAARAAAHLASPDTQFLRDQSHWDPFAFIDLCEFAAPDPTSDTAALARQIALLEWQILFDHTYRAAVGQ